MNKRLQELELNKQQTIESIDLLNSNKSLSRNLALVIYSELIKTEWEIKMIKDDILSTSIKESIHEDFMRKILSGLPPGDYQFQFKISNINNEIIIENVKDYKLEPVWEEKKNFILEKFNEADINFEEVKNSEGFDIWKLGNKIYNVKFTHHKKWYGITQNAIKSNYNFIFINSDFTFCLLDNKFISNLLELNILKPTNKGGNKEQKNLIIDWDEKKIGQFDIQDKIGVVGISYYSFMFN